MDCREEEVQVDCRGGVKVEEVVDFDRCIHGWYSSFILANSSLNSFSMTAFA